MHALANDYNVSQHKKPKRKSYKKLRKINASILKEDMEILEVLEVLKDELAYVHRCLDQITEPALIDSYIYEVQAINSRYAYYLNLCKERGLMADMAL